MLWGFLLQGKSREALLQAQNNLGQWIDVPAKPKTLVCSLGEMFELATRGMFPATTHRVLMPKAEDRISVNWFIGPTLAYTQQDSGLPIAAEIRRVWGARVSSVKFEGREDNAILASCGENMLKGMIRSHPVMAQIHHPRLFAMYGYKNERRELF